MGIFNWIRFFIGAAFILCGLIIFFIEVYGLFHFKYVLNRMHAAAMGDTLGIACALLGLIIISGLTATSLKLCVVILFLWMASPVASHLIARLEVNTQKGWKNQCKEEDE